MVLSIAEALRRFSRKEKGFTLIELVIVIAIIAILIAVAIPIYQNVTRSAAQKSHDSNLKMIDSAVMQYFMDKGEYPKAISDLVGDDKNLKELPAIPELLKTSHSDWTNYELDGADPPWAGPVGDWEGGYRSTATGG